MRKWIVGASVAILAMSAVLGMATAQEEPPDPPRDPDPVTTNVEVRVWQDVNNPLSVYISARPENGSWAALGTIPLPLNDGRSSSGRFRYGDIAVGVPVGAATATVEVRVWQDVNNPLSVYISARPEDGSWAALGTIPLPLDDGHSSSGRFRYGDITVAVTLGALPTPTSTPTPTPTPTPWVDPRPDNTYTLRELAAMPAPAAPQPPLRPDHVLALELDRGTSFDVYLVAADRVEITAIHNYESRKFAVLCDDPNTTFDYILCRYSEPGPLSESGTSRLSLFRTYPYPDEMELDSVLLDGERVTCEERPATYYYGRVDERLWWCYDRATYSAWEAAKERTLAVPDDPLERYLRAQGDAPLWLRSLAYEAAEEAANDDSQPAAIAWQYAEGVGNYTTSAFEVRPYVRHWVSPDPSSAAVTLVCVPNDPEPGGYLAVTAGDLIVFRLWDGEFTARASFLCEFEIETAGEWSLEVGIEVQ